MEALNGLIQRIGASRGHLEAVDGILEQQASTYTQTENYYNGRVSCYQAKQIPTTYHNASVSFESAIRDKAGVRTIGEQFAYGNTHATGSNNHVQANGVTRITVSPS